MSLQRPDGATTERPDGSATVFTRAANGMNAPLVRVEVHLSGGLPQFNIVGLPETAVRESRQRVRSALIQCGYAFPQSRITANLAPADLPKTGTRFDLPIALGILVASNQAAAVAPEDFEFVGELGLSGALRGVGTVLSSSLACSESGRILCLAKEDAREASLASAARLIAADSLAKLLDEITADSVEPNVATLTDEESQRNSQKNSGGSDIADVIGHLQPKRALEIAAAGTHGLLMIGPPGCGKSMLAARLPGLLPPMTEREAMETARIHSIAGSGVAVDNWRCRPFRSPHHSASAPALVGGGRLPTPGEISLAHNGVLFLDELPEFGRSVLEQLREPMETGGVVISRAMAHTWFPARFQLIAAMNPCPCGWFGEPTGRCRCSPHRIEGYRGRISGPLLDRMDMHIDVNPIAHEHFVALSELSSESSKDVRVRICRAFSHQRRRGVANALLPPGSIHDDAMITVHGRSFLADSANRRQLSIRSHHRVFRVARTIADLADSVQITQAHIAEALSLRCLDRVADSP